MTSAAVRAGAPPVLRRAEALTATTAVVLALATGKWGAYLGVPPVFPTDVLLVLAVLHVLVRFASAGPVPPSGAAGRGWPGLVAALFLGYAVLRFAAGADHSLTALRDFAPYGYCLVAFLSARSYHLCSPATRRRTVRLLHAALLFHLAWVIVVRLLPGVADGMPTVNAEQGLRLFALRGSTDSTIAGITGVLYLLRFLRGGGLRSLTVVVLSFAVVLTIPARAALLGVAASLALMLWLSCYPAPGRPVDRQRRLLAAGVVPALVMLVAVLVPQTAPGAKLLVGFGVEAAQNQTDLSAIGTKEGRSEAWRRVETYVAETHAIVLGVGFGPDFLFASGGRGPLGNGENLRSPHNYVVGSYARLGGVGVALLLSLLVMVGREVVRMRRMAAADDLLAFAIAFASGFFVSAVFGVELEAPFGAVPFFWCLGLILARPALAAAAEPSGAEDRCGP